MNLNYSLRDAEEWAAFSGDYNPIHFDLQHVRQMGLEQLSVHGMRAMLDMKRHLSAALLVSAPLADYYAFSARMRQPVLCQTPYHLQITGNGAPVNGKLLDSTTQQSCFTGKLTVAQPLLLAVDAAEHALTVAEVMELAQRFPGDVAEATQAWSFFDALLFQLLVKSPETLATLTTALPELTAATLIDVFAQIRVVQTHHETHFSARLFTPDAHLQLEERLHYAIQPMLIMGDKNNGFVLRAVIQARIRQQPLIMTAVTLKTWPLAAN
ncbi:MaoC/PaaZ C-terminal domain-containing protein [Serratia sp. L9]|uniref:MaoC/PaaZ C-terminal domain-containing protein n=1 Tax=Serratia sp. L9 TaxID=3423946 RepID=UPI003D67DE99